MSKQRLTDKKCGQLAVLTVIVAPMLLATDLLELLGTLLFLKKQ